MRSLPFYSRLWFAPILVLVGAVIGGSWFCVENIYEPVDELDFWFYFRGYSSIGAATGFAAWYFARLVARQHASFHGLACLAAPAYFFVVWIALDKNPLVVALATAVFGLILLLSFLAQRRVRSGPPA